MGTLFLFVHQTDTGCLFQQQCTNSAQMADQNTHDLKNQQLLSAYVDGELGVADRALAESLIRDNPHYAQLVEQWRESGINLRALPKQRLDNGFADRVLGRIDQLADPDDVAGDSFEPTVEGSLPALAVGNSNQRSNHPIALLAIGALCASILLTLFAFPALVSQSPSAATAVAAKNAEENNAEENNAEEKAEPKTVSKTEPTFVSDSSSDSSQSLNAQQESRFPLGPMVRAPRSMKMAGSELQSGAIAAIEMAQPAEHVEQILHVKVEPADRQFNIERVLNKHSIKTFGIKEPSSSAGQSNVEAIYAVASLDQIRAAAEQLVEEFSAKVAIVSVPQMPIDENSATRLKSRSFDSQSSDSELAQLDQWFGLSGSDNESRSIRFLILLTQ